MSAPPAPDAPEPAPPRRAYDNTLRRQRAAETRERIVTAGSELLHGAPVREFQGLTVRAVAERAGVNERTIYRHFESERGLRDAVMHRLEQEADISLEGMRLEDLAALTTRLFEHVASFPPTARPTLDPTLSEAKARQQQALLDAVGAGTAGWSPADRRTVAAVFDVLWSVAAFERLVADWDLDPGQATAGLTWVIGLVEAAIAAGEPPSGAR
ncbi:TetR/AcrR family transcriptional regulator [Aquihabitans sp. McL0605]|uniref:TetR/AcrR family transcriptional regulator n=1 Tax=Aquihabitans sp. McL0605 TaxID=3415671 RepID=UPI003CF93125